MTETTTLERPAAAGATRPPGGLKATVERGALLKALTDVQAVVERRNTIPILSNVKIEAANGRVTLTGTDLSIEIRLEVPAMVEAEGHTTVSSDLLHGIVRETADGAQISIASKDGKLAVTSGRGRYSLHQLPTDDFPSIGCNALDTAFELPAAGLRGAIAKVAHAQSTEEIRAYLNGIVLQVEADGAGGRLSFAATDGYCMAHATLPLPAGAAGMSDVIIPRKTVAQLLRLLDGRDGAVTVELSPTRLRFAFGGTLLTSKAVEGSFPDWRRVMPSNNPLRLCIRRVDLEAGIKRVVVVASEKTRAVKLAVDRDRVTLSVTSPQNGTAAEEVLAAYDQDPIEIGFNARYVQETLRAMGGDEVQIELLDPGAPPLFTNPADPAARWVVMPMRV